MDTVDIDTLDDDRTNNNNEVLNCDLDVNKCIHINKLITSLNYYKLLNIIENTLDENNVLHYCCNIYLNNDLKIINKTVEKCNFKNCKYSKRHYNM